MSKGISEDNNTEECKHIWLPVALGKMCQRCFLYISVTGMRMKFKSLDAFKKG